MSFCHVPTVRQPSRHAGRIRNVIGRSFNTLKRWRGLATRYVKIALIYRRGAVLSAIIIWLHESGDTP